MCLVSPKLINSLELLTFAPNLRISENLEGSAKAIASNLKGEGKKLNSEKKKMTDEIL